VGPFSFRPKKKLQRVRKTPPFLGGLENIRPRSDSTSKYIVKGKDKNCGVLTYVVGEKREAGQVQKSLKEN